MAEIHMTLLRLVTDIRKEAGDPDGKLMHDELIERIRLQARAAAILPRMLREIRFTGYSEHSHERPGVWDEDNGELSGQQCEWCETLAEAEEITRKHC